MVGSALRAAVVRRVVSSSHFQLHFLGGFSLLKDIFAKIIFSNNYYSLFDDLEIFSLKFFFGRHELPTFLREMAPVPALRR